MTSSSVLSFPTSTNRSTPTTNTSNTNGTNNANTNSKTTKLVATILSTYDLPQRDPPPSYVSMTVLLSKTQQSQAQEQSQLSIQTGPPIQRHKDKSSFKFSTDTISLYHNSLPELYSSTVQIAVVYNNNNNNSGESTTTKLIATYPMKQLKIHETIWLVLPLEEEKKANETTSAPETTTMTLSNNNNNNGPTIRLTLTLHGPYRSEIGFLLDMAQQWFHFVDTTQHVVETSIVRPIQTICAPPLRTLSTLFSGPYALLAAAPILVAIVVATPVLLGAMVVTLPLAVPVLVALIGIVAAILCAGALLYCSTLTGRTALLPLFQPIVNTLLSTPAGQGMIYNTGPRPTPVSVCRAILPTSVWSRFLISLCIDALGSASYLIPGVGEVGDMAWAPIQTILIMALYDDTAEVLKYVSFVEEILPFTDIVPTATIGWCIEVVKPLVLPPTTAASSTTTASPTTAPSNVTSQKLLLGSNTVPQQYAHVSIQ